ncbi:MAG: hypothetical protein ASARMPREDX12_004672 [Alectoria sarmentosa]|nr:MAG: hypothetical protein ASARMPREDX12_004672 [Alectoria sarmentosa]
MTSPYDPCGKIYTLLSEDWTTFLWFFEPVFIPQAFRDHLVLVLGWTAGRRGYVSIAMHIIPDIPEGVNPDYYCRIRSPRRRLVANEIAVTLRKNKRFAALVESSYIRLDWVWEVPFAILLVVPRTGMQLMLRAVSMEKIMRFYSQWGLDEAWGQTYRSLPESFQWAGCCQDRNDSGPPENLKEGGESGYTQWMRQPIQVLDGLASSGSVEQVKDAAVAGSDKSWDSTYKPDDEEERYSKELTSPCARQEMVYAGDAHCAALAKLLQEVQGAQ